MTPQEHANRVIQQSGVETWQPQFGIGTLIRLLRANIAWEIEQAIQEERARAFRKAGEPILCGVSTEGAAWAMEGRRSDKWLA